MPKETTIKVSIKFKEYLRGEQQSKEDYEATIKRLIGIPKVNSPIGIPTDSILQIKETKKSNSSIPQIKEIKKEMIITSLPRDPLQIVKHQTEYGN
jgi:hypothetical protein